MGEAAGIAGDVNGDGFADVVLGSPGCDGVEVDEGRVFLHYGSPRPPDPDGGVQRLDGDGYGFPAGAACPGAEYPDCNVATIHPCG